MVMARSGHAACAVPATANTERTAATVHAKRFFIDESPLVLILFTQMRAYIVAPAFSGRGTATTLSPFRSSLVLVLFAQRVLLHLAHCVTYQFLHKMDTLGYLEVGQRPLERGDHVVGIENMPCTRHHNSHYRFAEIGIRYPDYGRLIHTGQCINDFLDFLWIYVVST